MQLVNSNRGAPVVAGGRPPPGVLRRRWDLSIGDLAPAAIALSLTLMGCSNLTPAGGDATSQGHLTMRVADAALAAGAPDVALRVADLTLRDAPRDVPALVAKGDALYAMGHLDLARGAYRSAIAVDPTSVDALVGLGRTLVRSDPKAAEAAFLDAATRQPNNVAALSNLGIARDLQGRHDAAQAAYRQALVAADSTDITLNLGLSLALSGKPAEAVALLRPLARQADTTGLRRNDLAAALAIAGDRAESDRVLHGESAPGAGVTWPADTTSVETPLVAIASPVRGRAAPPADAASLPTSAADAAPASGVPGTPPMTDPAAPARGMPTSPPSTAAVPPVAADAGVSQALDIRSAPVVPVMEATDASTTTQPATATSGAPLPTRAVHPSLATPAVERVVPRRDGGPVRLAAVGGVKPPAVLHRPQAVGSQGPAEAVPDVPAIPAPATDTTTQAPKADPGLSTHSGDRFCQLAALDTEQRAKWEWQHLQNQMPELLSGRTPTIMSADVHGRTFWRLRTGGFRTAAEQSAFCSQVRGLGLDCW